MKNKLQNIITSFFLKQDTKQYYVEAQVQHKLAIEIYKQFAIEAELEYYYKNTHNDNNSYLDIFFESPHGSRIGIELKYKTRCYNAGDTYKNQGAQNNSKYDFIKDIQRLEEMKSNNLIDTGYALLITNDHTYWTAARPDSMVSPFDLTDNTTLTNTYIPEWKDRTEPIVLTNSYILKWDSLEDAAFKSLLVEV